MRRFRSRLTFANVIACLALFIALGGTGYAAFKLPKGSVGNRQLKRNAVTSSKIKRGGVGLGDIKASAKSKLGGLTKVVMREGPSVTVRKNNDVERAEVECLPGEQATGGGMYNGANLGRLHMTGSYPLPNPVPQPSTGNGQVANGWRIWVINDSLDTDYSVTAYVLCAS